MSRARDVRHAIQALAHAFDEEDNAASDLWSWLPSHKAAEKHHGDYASEYRPDLADVMKEAAMHLADLTDAAHGETRERTPEELEWYACPCGEDHDAPAEEEADR